MKSTESVLVKRGYACKNLANLCGNQNCYVLQRCSRSFLKKKKMKMENLADS